LIQCNPMQCNPIQSNPIHQANQPRHEMRVAAMNVKSWIANRKRLGLC
jgi:hypothetical protein